MTQKIGLIGCGRWGKNILRDLLLLDCEVIVVAPSEKTRQQAIQLGAKKSYTTIHSIADPIDGFVVATPTSTHREVIEQLLPSNKPIFVEKPMTCDEESAKHFAQIGKEKIFVMDKWRYHPGIEALAKKAKSGALGNIRWIKSYRLDWGYDHPDTDSIWILLPHDLVIAFHILGYLPPLHSVVAIDPTNPTLGLTVTLKGEKTPSVIIEMSILQPVRQRSITVVGDRGTVQLGNSYDEALVFYQGSPGEINASRHEIVLDSSMPLFLELQAFVNHLKGGPPPLSSAADGALVVERIAAIRKQVGL